LRDIWKLQSNEEDIALIIDRIVVMADGTAKVHLIDGRVQQYTFPEFHPAKYKEEKQNWQTPRKNSANKSAVKEQDAPQVITACQNCGAEIVQKPKVKQRKFCCNECRNQWWNQHLDEVDRKTYYEIICRHCGKVTTVYGDSRRKYCSHECYIAHRYKKKQDSLG